MKSVSLLDVVVFVVMEEGLVGSTLLTAEIGWIVEKKVKRKRKRRSVRCWVFMLMGF